jgi:hypothetical protein
MLTLQTRRPWPAAVNRWMHAPQLDRPQYILVNDEQVQAVDPLDKLYWALGRAGCLTIVDAKKLHAGSIAPGSPRLVFHEVPEAARDRFLQLAAEVTGARICYSKSCTTLVTMFALRSAVGSHHQLCHLRKSAHTYAFYTTDSACLVSLQHP